MASATSKTHSLVGRRLFASISFAPDRKLKLLLTRPAVATNRVYRRAFESTALQRATASLRPIASDSTQDEDTSSPLSDKQSRAAEAVQNGFSRTEKSHVGIKIQRAQSLAFKYLEQQPDSQEDQEFTGPIRPKRGKHTEKDLLYASRQVERQRRHIINQLSLFAATIHPVNIERLRKLAVSRSAIIDPIATESEPWKNVRDHLATAFPNVDAAKLATGPFLPQLESIIEASVRIARLPGNGTSAKVYSKQQDEVQDRQDQARFHDLYLRLQREVRAGGNAREMLFQLGYKMDIERPWRHWERCLIRCILCFAFGPEKATDKACLNFSKYKMSRLMWTLQSVFGRGIFSILPLNKASDIKKWSSRSLMASATAFAEVFPELRSAAEVWERFADPKSLETSPENMQVALDSALSSIEHDAEGIACAVSEMIAGHAYQTTVTGDPFTSVY